MKKEEFVEKIAQKTGLPKSRAAECLGAVLDEITKSLSQGKEVVLTGFGKFSVAKRKARAGINPQTKAKIKIPATKVPRFKAGRVLKDAVK